MSSALVRQALEFVDQDNDLKKRNKRRSAPVRYPGDTGQVSSHPYKKTRKNSNKKQTSVTKETTVEDNIKKLLALSSPVADSTITDKIVQRAVKGKPLLEKIEVKKDEEKSILFPEETFKKFERSYFCS